MRRNTDSEARRGGRRRVHGAWIAGLELLLLGCGPGLSEDDAQMGGTSSSGASDDGTGVFPTTGSGSGGVTTTAEPSCDPVSLDDPDLEEAVRAALEKPQGPLTAQDMASLTELQATWIDTLEGLECAVNLESLEIQSSKHVAVDLAPIAALTSLRSLRFSGTAYHDPQVDLGPVAGLVELETLALRYVVVSDLEPVASLPNLAHFELTRSEVGDLSPLGALPQLGVLDLSDTPIADPTVLTSLGNLTWLSLTGTGVVDLQALSGLTKLRTLYLLGNRIHDLGPLSGLSQLEEIDIGRTAVTDLSPLAGLSSLVKVEAAHNQIEDVTPLSAFPTLVSINLEHNQIIDLSPLLGSTWELPMGCGDIRLFGNPLSEESKMTYAEQVCVEGGIYMNYCSTCENSCVKLCPCGPEDPPGSDHCK